MEEKNKNRVFVYGTLRDREGEYYVSPTHYIKGYFLYDYYGKFPYIVESEYAKEPVWGNVMFVDDEELENLDFYEGVAKGLYTRETVEVFEKDGDIEEGEYMHVYVAKDIAPKLIESGDWADV